MTETENLLAIGGPCDGKALTIGTREWELATWVPAPVTLSLYDVARMPDPVRDVYDSGTRTRYVRTRFSVFQPSVYGESNAWTWVLLPEDTQPGQAEANVVAEAMIRGLATAFLGAARRWVTFADEARSLSDEVHRIVQAAYREADERLMREIVYGTDGNPRPHRGLNVTAVPGEDDPILAGIMRPPPAANWQEFFDNLGRGTYSEPEFADACACPSCADDCWRCDAAPAATDVGLCDNCRNDLREPVAA